MYRTKSQLIGNVSTGASFAGIITASGLSADTVNISGVTTIANITFSSGIITSTSGVVTFYGDGSGLTGISAGSTVFDDTSTDATFYPVFTDTTSGLLSTSRVSTTNLTFNPSSSTLQVGTGITLSGSDGSISIAGTIFASSLSVPIEVSSFDPAIGSTSVGVSSNIIINFNQTVGLGTTGFFEIRTGLNTTGGTLVERVGVNSARATIVNGGRRLIVDPTSNFGFVSSFYVTMSAEFVGANGSNFAGINTVGTAQTYFFTTKALVLGDSYEGGFLICQSGGTRWVVAPSSAQVARAWNTRTDANTRSQVVSGCTGWFVPSCAQLKNPGYVCRTYWDSYGGRYWSNTEFNATDAFSVCFSNPPFVLAGCGLYGAKFFDNVVRSFRCVSY
jgi:hypothetical protein